MKALFAAAVLTATLATAAAPAQAVMIADGTVTSAYLFSPTVNLATSPATYAVMNGGTFQVTGTGGFAGAAGRTGTLNGSINFSTTVGTTLNETLNDLFVFSDGAGGTFNFSATSVTTRTFANTPGITTSGSIYLLGTTLDSNLNLDATATSLTISFNSTGSSSYSSSATLAVPPAPLPPTDVPEPLSLALLGTGVLAAGVIRRATSKA